MLWNTLSYFITLNGPFRCLEIFRMLKLKIRIKGNVKRRIVIDGNRASNLITSLISLLQLANMYIESTEAGEKKAQTTSVERRVKSNLIEGQRIQLIWNGFESMGQNTNAYMYMYILPMQKYRIILS